MTHKVFPILEDDGFDTVPEKDARPGDIVVYCDERGEVCHSGFVVQRKEVEIIPGRKSVVPVIWSKWGKGCEVIHSVGECPYMEAGTATIYFRLKRWKP